MQERNEKQSSGGPLGIRFGVWFACGLFLVSVLLVSILRRHPIPAPVETERTTVDAPQQTPSLDRKANIRPVHHGAAAENEAVTLTRMSTPIHNELTIAKEKLAKLRGSHSEEHPDVQAQLRAVESLERSVLTPGETVELAKARADLAKAEVYLDSQHPESQALRAVVQSLEQSAAAGETVELAQAKAQLARLRVNYADQHPDVQSQLKKIAELQQ